MSANDTKKKKTTAKLYRLPTRLTRSTVVDAQNREVEITEFMTRRACDIMDNQQQFPFAPRKRRNAG